MKRKTVLSVILAIAMLISIASVPAFADVTPTFSVQGKIVLPEVAATNLYITIKYRSDKGTDSATDYLEKDTLIILMAGLQETSFTLTDIPFTASADKLPKFTLGYSIPVGLGYPVTGYWETGYYVMNGTQQYMQYYPEGQTQFSEGSVSNIIITPIKASTITGAVSLPTYPITGTTAVEVAAKTTGNSTAAYDDYEAKTTVNITTAPVIYSLKVPAGAEYTVKYKTSAQGYEENGWYSATGTVKTETSATKLNAISGIFANINLQLITKTTTPNIPPTGVEYDLNGDKKVDVKDLVIIARAMGSIRKFDVKFDLNKDGKINVADLKIMKQKVYEQKLILKQEKKETKNQGK